MSLSRRHFLAGTAAAAALIPLGALAQSVVNAADFGLVADPVSGGPDQSTAFRAALQGAIDAGRPLFVPGGYYTVGGIELASNITIVGVRGSTVLRAARGDPVLMGSGVSQVTLRDVVLEGTGGAGNSDRPGLLTLIECSGVETDGIEARGGSVGIYLAGTSGVVAAAMVRGAADTGIFALDGRNLILRDNRIFDCGNGGIRVWASAEGRHDGTLVAGNDISDIRTEGGGNGQNGNGINVYRANGVTVTDNRVSNCAFSAIRLNSSNDTIVANNTCLDSGEVAIFSEFAFSGSVIANNIVDRAAQGISMTNFDQGGHLATCTGNIVRNIAPSSLVNPDTTPVGIFAEADAVIANNVVETVPGLGIGAGWGPYLRDVAVTGNVVRDCDVGIGVSVAKGAGRALVNGNLVSGSRRAGIAALAWTEVVTDDLVRDADRFANVSVSGNSVS